MRRNLTKVDIVGQFVGAPGLASSLTIIGVNL
jgi:hypothetical protein